ncbi:cytochrome P450 [Thelonectria olida]|uniref:Cytochrome P450 n=1 Tax=Thelonectria olida TaxID=1576542 RepID=A0A9P9AP57_9HYPO|nr:cytochrome P450 [Thelonectria olida]
MASAVVGDAASGPVSRGLIAELLNRSSSTAGVFVTVILASVIVVPLLNRFLTPRLDPREPPVVKPTIPYVGHILGIIRHQNDYHRIIHNAHPSQPIATLPMLNGKIYAIFDPHLVQAVLRNKIASFEPFVTDFAQKTFGLTAETFAKITSNSKIVPEFTDAIHASFQTEMLHKMNVHFLSQISARLGAISTGTVTVDANNGGKEVIVKNGLQVDNLYLWCRDVMSLATTRALYGNSDPYNADPSLVEMAWTFEASVPYFLLSLFPSLTMPKAYQARTKLQAIMKDYYTEKRDLNDPTTSQLVINRANALRKNGFTGDEVGLLEVILPVVATINAVPTFYWLLLYIFARPDLTAQLRAEVEAAATLARDDNGERIVSFNITKFDEQLPLLISCYRETMRLTNHSVSMRRVMSDLVIKAPDGNESYLLKKGTDLQLPAGVTHYEQSIWGDDASEFVPDRFAPAASKDKTTETEKKKKAAYFPFGGGRHLCPGRNLAFAEILGFISVLLLGFDVEPIGMGFADMEMSPPVLASGAVKPKNRGIGLGGKLLRRKGWEDVRWHFEC